MTTLIPSVSSADIVRVKGAFDCYTSTVYTKGAAAVAYISTFNDTELWLLSFAHFMITKHSKAIDFSPYYAIPTGSTQVSTFEDFLQIVRRYMVKSVTAKNEKPLIQFLRGCTAEIRDFYEMLMSKPKEACNMISRKEVRDYTNLNKIYPEDVYGYREEKWDDLTFPLLITTAPPALPMAIIYKEGKTTRVATYMERSSRIDTLRKTSLHRWLYLDEKTVHTSSYLLIGLLDEGGKKFYPLDFYNSVKEYSTFRKKDKGVVPYATRFKNLENFLATNYLRQIQKMPAYLVTDAMQIADTVATVLKGSPFKTVTVCDGKSKLVQTTTKEVFGVIGDFWKEANGTVRGFKVWHSGRAVNCSFDFSGESQALLFNPQLVIGKVADFFLFEQHGEAAGFIKEIHVTRKGFKPTPYTFNDGEVGYIECCAFSTGTKAHSHQGVCDSSIKNFFYMFKTYGTDVWIKPSTYLSRRREAHGWRHQFLNRLEVVFRGYYVVANEQGEVMFRTDEKAMQIYQERLLVPAYNRTKEKHE